MSPRRRGYPEPGGRRRSTQGTSIGGGLDQALALEEQAVGLVNAIASGGLGPFFYRYADPGEL